MKKCCNSDSNTLWAVGVLAFVVGAAGAILAAKYCPYFKKNNWCCAGGNDAPDYSYKHDRAYADSPLITDDETIEDQGYNRGKK